MAEHTVGFQQSRLWLPSSANYTILLMRPRFSPHVGQLTVPCPITTEHAPNFGQLSPKCVLFVIKEVRCVWISANLFSPLGKIYTADGRSVMSLQCSDFQPFSSHGAHGLIIEIRRHIKKEFADLKKRYNFDQFTEQIIIIIVITYPFCSKVTFLKIRCPYLYKTIRLSVTKN